MKAAFRQTLHSISSPYVNFLNQQSTLLTIVSTFRASTMLTVSGNSISTNLEHHLLNFTRDSSPYSREPAKLWSLGNLIASEINNFLPKTKMSNPTSNFVAQSHISWSYLHKKTSTFGGDALRSSWAQGVINNFALLHWRRTLCSTSSSTI